MTVRTTMTVGGTNVIDYRNLTVQKTVGEYTATSSFNVVIDSPFGRHGADFTVGNEVIIKADQAEGYNTTGETNTAGSAGIGLNVFGTTHWAQIFTIGVTGPNQKFTMSSLTIKVHRILTPGTVNVAIRHVNSANNPTGDDLSTGSFDGDAITADTGGEDKVVTMTEVTLYKDIKYALELSALDTGAGESIEWHTLAGEYAGGPKRTGSVESWSEDLSASGLSFVFTITRTSAPSTNLLVGVLDSKEFVGRGNTQQLVLRGRDYSARLMDGTVEPTVFTDSEVSTIVTGIINDNTEDLLVGNIQTTNTTLSRIVFNHVPVFKALEQLADLSGFTFQVDENKEVNFSERKSISSQVTLDNTNIMSTNFDTTREGMANRVWVYGDRYLTGVREILEADGGSVFTLVSKPHNTEIETSDEPGSRVQGGVFELTVVPTSGPNYLVSFHNRQLVFVSGTDIGYDAIPTSGGSIVALYDREVPIVKFGLNRPSIAAFGPKTKVINDKTIRDPSTASIILNRELQRSDPLRKVELDLKGWFTFTPSETIDVIISDFNLVETGLPIINITYIFDRNTIQSEKIIKVRIDNKMRDLTDSIVDLKNRLDLIEAEDRQDTDVITRLEIGLGSVSVLGSYFEIRQRFNGSGFILGGSNIARPSGLVADHPGLGRLGSTVAGSASLLGLAGRTGVTTVESGGFDYSTL